MNCPACGIRKPRRACPALRADICPVCCGTKRLVAIQCPEDCAYLAASREHPAAPAVRRQQVDVAAVIHLMRDFNEWQMKLFLEAAAILINCQLPALQRLQDQDVADAAAALAATLETSVKGVLYTFDPASAPAKHLTAAMRPLFETALASGGTALERDAAIVLRRIEASARPPLGADPASRPFLDLLQRVIKARGPGKAGDAEPPGAGSPLIVL